MLRCLVSFGLLAGLAGGPSGWLFAQEDKSWQDDQLKKLSGRWTALQEQKVWQRVDLEFTDGRVKVSVVDDGGGKRLFDGDLRLLGVEKVRQPGLGNVARLAVGATTGTGKTDVYYDLLGERLILVGVIGWRPFEGLHLSGEYKRAETPK
jgi:hypothetical protein